MVQEYQDQKALGAPPGTRAIFYLLEKGGYNIYEIQVVGNLKVHIANLG